MKRLKALVIFVILCVVPALSVWAHPHIFITPKAVFQFEDSTLKGIREEWLFDEIYGSTLIMDYDRNRDKTFSANELKKIKAEAFDNLQYYNYFTFLYVNGVRKKELAISDFDVKIENGTVRYLFTINLDVRAGAKPQSVKLTMYDDTYFVAFDALHREDLSLSPESSPASFELSKAKVTALYPGQVMPDQTVLTIEAKQ